MPGTSEFYNDLQSARATIGDYLYGPGSELRSNQTTHWDDSWNNAAFNFALSNFEFKQNKEMWDLMNEYNSPASQMQRFKEAGLNPMLIYSQGNPGNASSQVQYKAPNVHLTPMQDRLNKIGQINQLVGSITGFLQNIAGLFDTGYDLQLKRNSVLQSNYETAQNYRLPGFGQGPLADVSFFPDSNMGKGPFMEINPFSDKFDPVMFMTLARQGNLPSALWNIWNSVPRRDYDQARVNYQQYYNEHLLPLFKDYQQGKVDLQEIEKEMAEYRKNMLNVIPPEWRGIIEPVLDWISPFFKFIFKSSNVNHSVK